MLELTSDLLEDARQGKRSAVIELLALYYPVVWRMSAGLTGRADVGKNVTRYLMQRSLRILSTWKDDGAPTRWFHHHTLLTTRRAGKPPDDGKSDTLLAPDGSNDPGYIAFIRAIRALPMQQREAYILAHGEMMDVRGIAIAMDCSVLAAGNHLTEAATRLKALNPKDLDVHAMRLGKIYRTLGPDEDLALTDIRRRVKTHYLPKTIWRITKSLLATGVFVGGIWGAWRAWQIVRHSMDH